MPKKAVIILELVDESLETSNSQIEKEIRAETKFLGAQKLTR